MADLQKLVSLLEFQFKDTRLLTTALTHRSASTQNNERLEFLGDSVLNFVIAEELFKRYPDSSEGDLSRLRAALVKKEGLAKIAHDLVLGDYITLGSGELKSGGHRRDSILADAVEAVFGSVYLDAGFDAAKELILRLYTSQLEDVPDPQLLKDPKTRLQELLQSRKYPLPVYQVINVTGKAHKQTFTVNCHIEDLAIDTLGQSSSRRKAEQKAAEEAINEVQKHFSK
jgi:ribonuclease-3